MNRAHHFLVTFALALSLMIPISPLSRTFPLGDVAAQQGHDEREAAHEGVASDHGHVSHAALSPGWEGSDAGVAYSERNHHIAGWLVLLMGLAELSHALRLPAFSWARMLLPAAMACTGIFLLVWSDHEAWPIGRLSFADTFFGQDHEILQHKAYGLLALFVGAVELVRRFGRIGHAAWSTPLPLLAVVGGLMLFVHSHGAHPAAQKIALHHAIMGTLAVTAGSSKLWSGWSLSSKTGASLWELLWAGLILIIGAQLLIYSE